MEPGYTLHLLAGIGAFALGAGLLLREPSRGINRSFALLCAAIALWNLGFLLRDSPNPATRPFYLLGSCVSGPLGLHFALHLAGAAKRTRRLALGLALIPAAVLWLGTFVPAFSLGVAWHRSAIAIVGGTLAMALAVIARHALGLPRGPERRAMGLIVVGGIIATVGGVSDFVPRGEHGIAQIGPLAMLLFLLIVCAVLVQVRFVDVDAFVIRLVALLAGAAAVASIFLFAARWSDRYTVFFVVSLGVLAVAGPLGRVILSRARSLLGVSPVTRTLLATSRELPKAQTVDDVWRTIEAGRAALPGEVWVDVWMRRADQRRFHLTYRSPANDERAGEPLTDDHALVQVLIEDGLPVTRRYLEREAGGSAERERAGRALEVFDREGIRLLVPLSTGRGVVGWLAVGGSLDERLLTASAATEFMAVGNEAAAVLSRIEAQETARKSEALAAVGELAAGLAHEVRNPVAAIRGASQAMGPAATDEQRQEMLEVIGEETERLGRFVGEFLDYARPGSPRADAVDLPELARRALQGFALSGRSLAAEVVEDDDPPPAAGDPDQLRRAFDNLIRNAWEAAGEGARLRIEVFRAGDDAVGIRFEDNGPGIPAAEVAKLFQPFHTTKPAGTGLGLALIHRIVEAHGGRIHVDGRPGLGAAFTLTLPTKRR